ncbi:hypothetical protein BH09PAT2_BH09PAT2_10470 [soil metagenome]
MHTIREYTNHDVDDVKKILTELQEFERIMDPQRLHGLEVAREYLQHLLTLCDESRGKIFVVEVENEVVGMVSVYIEEDTKHMRKTRKYAYISDLMVLPQYRSEGVTKELLAAAESYAKSKNINVIQASVLSEHKDGLAGYTHNGFSQFEIVLRKHIS